MIKVGITGGIGAGKSICAKVFLQLGIPLYDADSRAKVVMHQSFMLQVLQEYFGNQIISEGKLDRNLLSKIVFEQPEKLNWLNNLVHPAVAKDYANWLDQHSSASYTLKESALLVETKAYKELDKLIVVCAPEPIRMQRILKRDAHRSKEQIIAIFDRQASEQTLRSKADYIIENDDTTMVVPQIIAIHKQILSEV